MKSLVIPANFVSNLVDDLEESTNTRLSSGVTAYGEDIFRELVEGALEGLMIHRDDLDPEELDGADLAHDEFMRTSEVLEALEGLESKIGCDIDVEQDIIYTDDILEVFADNPHDVSDALADIGLDGVDLLHAVMMGVNLYVERVVQDAVSEALDDIRDAVEDYEL